MKSEKIKTIFSVSTIVLFIFFIITPLALFNRESGKVSALDNKKLATFPDILTSGGEFNKSFFSDFEAYINDNIGLKQETVIADIVVEYKLFDKIKIPNYILGKDKNLFYTTGGQDIRTFQGNNLYSKNELEKLANGFSKMQSYFKNSGAKFYMMTIPNKEAIYPELYPKEIKQISNKSKIDLLTDYITSNTTINVLNVKQALISNKGNSMLYYKNYDCTHWNMDGAFIGYIQIMNELKKQYPELEILKKNDFNINTEKSKGSLKNLDKFEIINKTMSFDDDIYNYKLKREYQAKLVNDNLDNLTLEVNDKFFHYINSSKPKMPKILIVGDSYIYSFILPILAESFSELYFINFRSAQLLMDLQNQIRADVVLYEFVERAFYDQIYYLCENFQDDTVKNIDFIKLPIDSYASEFHIDIPVLNNNVLTVDRAQESQNISGWAIDVKAGALLGDLYLKVGTNYYKPQLIERPDLKKDKYLKAGFSFHVSTNELLKAKKVRFYLVSNNNKYQYNPIDILIN